jgi:hypothetical protein
LNPATKFRIVHAPQTLYLVFLLREVSVRTVAGNCPDRRELVGLTGQIDMVELLERLLKQRKIHQLRGRDVLDAGFRQHRRYQRVEC